MPQLTSIALALGAGGARGLAHIHVLKAFDDLGIKPALIAGTSIGALIGAAYASGMTGAEIEEYVIRRFDDRLTLMKDAFSLRPQSVTRIFADGGFRLAEFNLQAILAAFLPPQIPDQFERLSTPLRVVATDFHRGEAKVFRSGDLRLALSASAAIPAVFNPVQMDSHTFIDGSATDPCPLGLLQGCADHILAIDVSGGPDGKQTGKPSKVDVLYANSQIMQRAIVAANARMYPATTVLRPSIANIRALDFLKTREILDMSRAVHQETKVAIERFFE